MPTPPRQPEQVELNLTAEPGEGAPGDRADPVFRRDVVNIKIWLSKVAGLGVELAIEESEANGQTSAVVQYAIIMLLTLGGVALFWVISHHLVLSVIVGAVMMVAGIVFVRTHSRKRAN
ncbi:hypothetical protein ACIBMZ_09525 [Micromonospora sp. NPDC049900]|uniref:hypothetical protein n=1 Tax=Micromonospora sp. NPDC049900 TaxID=3364275 RepID=UPI003787DD42